MTRYIGNGAYCYANSAAMLLAAAGETISPGTIEVMSGVGLGAAWQPDTATMFFSNLRAAPDTGVSKALELLGFSFVEQAQDDAAAAPFDSLREALERGPVVLGPLDMGYLVYLPFHAQAAGADHFVLAQAIDGDTVQLHDPAGFPFVSLALGQLSLAWRAERIAYRRGAFRMWTAPRRERQPDEDELWSQACGWFAECYRESDAIVAEGRFGSWLGGSEAIRGLARQIEAGGAKDLRGWLTGFSLPLGARRAGDFAEYFARHDRHLANAKHRQAALFGRGHVQAVNNDWPALAATLGDLATVEDEIRAAVLDRAAGVEVARG